MILVFGSINIDLVARVASIPRPGETVLSPRYVTLFGGKGANQAIASARASLPRRVTIAACVGDDAFGRSGNRGSLGGQASGSSGHKNGEGWNSRLIPIQPETVAKIGEEGQPEFAAGL